MILLSALLLSPGCGRIDPAAGRTAAPAPDEFSVMTYNLEQYNLSDRDGDGQKNDLKPKAQREAAVALIASVKPDVLAVQELGSPSVYEEFRYALRSAGLEYEHSEYLQRGKSEVNLAVFSRFPILSRNPHTEDSYSIGEAEVPVLRGFIDVEIQVNPSYKFRLMAAHLKSKVFHALGQTEMRRNEARLLNNHVRKVLKEAPDANLIVLGDFNDTYRSAPLREITGNKQEYLSDLRPRDVAGDAWTHFSPDIDQYDRIDYLLVSRGMKAEAVDGKTRVISDPLTYQASDHRPMVAVFKASDLPLLPGPADSKQAPAANSQVRETD